MNNQKQNEKTSLICTQPSTKVTYIQESMNDYVSIVHQI